MRTHLHPIIKDLIIRLTRLNVPDDLISVYLNVSTRTIFRVRALWVTTGEVERKDEPVGRKQLLDLEQIKFIETLIIRKKDISIEEMLQELHDQFGITPSKSTISRTLQRRNFTRKKLSKKALERDEQKRTKYMLDIAENYSPEQFVVLDESAVDRRITYRNYGWAPRGERATYKARFQRGKRYSVLPALSLSGLVDVQITEGSFDGALFYEFISDLLDEMNPFPLPNSVLLMDNCPIHKSDGLREMVESRGMRLVFLPPYSPDLSPIEMGFSCFKAWIKKETEWAQSAFESKDENDCIDFLLAGISAVMTQENALGWFRNCGYGYGPYYEE